MHASTKLNSYSLSTICLHSSRPDAISLQALQMVTEIRQPVELENSSPLFHPTSTRSSMGAGIPLVPEKMARRIEAEEHIMVFKGDKTLTWRFFPL